jgi:hypothetical protein
MCKEHSIEVETCLTARFEAMAACGKLNCASVMKPTEEAAR